MTYTDKREVDKRRSSVTAMENLKFRRVKIQEGKLATKNPGPIFQTELTSHPDRILYSFASATLNRATLLSDLSLISQHAAADVRLRQVSRDEEEQEQVSERSADCS
jgi:hypothetical protein